MNTNTTPKTSTIQNEKSAYHQPKLSCLGDVKNLTLQNGQKLVQDGLPSGNTFGNT